MSVFALSRSRIWADIAPVYIVGYNTITVRFGLFLVSPIGAATLYWHLQTFPFTQG
jgi:hypothetical protein